MAAQRRALELAARHVLAGVARSRVNDPDCAPEAAQSYVAKKFSHFLSLYAPDKLPAGRRLREMMNSMVLCVEGWDDDPARFTPSRRSGRFTELFTRLGRTGSTSAISIGTRSRRWSCAAYRRALSTPPVIVAENPGKREPWTRYPRLIGSGRRWAAENQTTSSAHGSGSRASVGSRS